MLSMLRRFAAQWSDWLGDRDLELSIRNTLNYEGYFGDSAKVKNLRLVALQRPGWLQIFIFSVETRRAAEASPSVKLAGIVRQDERYGRQEIRLFQRPFERNELYECWSRDLVRVRRL